MNVQTINLIYCSRSSCLANGGPRRLSEQGTSCYQI